MRFVTVISHGLSYTIRKYPDFLEEGCDLNNKFWEEFPCLISFKGFIIFPERSRTYKLIITRFSVIFLL